MTVRIKNYFSIAAMLFLAFNLFAIEGELIISGVIQDEGEVIPGANITITKNGTHSTHTMAKVNGEFSLQLLLGNDYNISFTKDGYVSKRIMVDAKDIDGEDIKKQFELHGIEIDLFEFAEGMRIDVLRNPVAKVKFDKENRNFIYDPNFNTELQNEIKQLWHDVSNYRYKRNVKYADKMKKADELFEDKAYLPARSGYVNALKIKRFASEPKEKIKLIDDMFGYNTVQASVTSSSETRVKNLSKPLPLGFSENIVKAKNKTVTQRTAIIDGVKHSFHKVVHHWGATFYFKDGHSITSRAWRTQTNKYF